MIVLIIDFKETTKSRLQVAAKEFILGTPDKGVKGILEKAVGKSISCYRFSLIRFPVLKTVSRARGAIGVFTYFGTSEQVKETVDKIREVWNDFSERRREMKGSTVEIYLAEKWLR
jgi:hypothetical protein